MPLMPFQILGLWLRGLLSLAIIGLGITLLREWNEHRRVDVVVPGVADREGRPREGENRIVEAVPLGFNRPTAELLGGTALMLLSVGGGSFVVPLRRKQGQDDPKSIREGETHRLKRPDGTELQVECHGPPDAPPMVLTHGWGADGTEWYYAKRALAGRYRLIVWDLPGLGLSKSPDTRDWSLDKMAGDLEAVLGLAGDRPALLVGHSIGGMIMLTFCRRFPEALGSRVAGLVLVHTTHTNPVKTTKMRALFTALQKSLLEPLCHLMIWLAPVVWVMNLLSYLNGSLQNSNDRQTFCGTESRGQLDWVSRFLIKAWPAVLARGMLGMFRYDATETLGTITVPTLVIAGDRDETTQPDASLVMAEAIPRAQLVTLAPAKHMGLIEHHDRWVEAVDQFAQSVARHEPITSVID